MKKILLCITTAILLSACGIGRPTAEQIAAADYGRVPKDPQQTVMEFMKMVLVDSTSAQYDKWSNVSKGWFKNFSGIYYGYKGCVYINAKNSLGGYRGFRPYLYIIKDDKIILLKGDMEIGTRGEEMVMEQCAPLYQTNANAVAVKANARPEPTTLPQQANPPAQRVNPKPLPIRVGE